MRHLSIGFSLGISMSRMPRARGLDTYSLKSVLALAVAPNHYRLRYEPDIKDIIVKLLQRLETHLQTRLVVKEPCPAHVEQPEEDSDSVYSSDSSLGISDDASFQEQESIGDPIPKKLVLEKVNETITHLYRVTAIKEPHSTKEEYRVRAWIARQGTEMDEQPHNLESYVSWSIGMRLPRAEQSSIFAVES
ncbi:hypothetical protein SLS58_007701 [Diplodia intermedia]|uniref:Uncharacterized protein n=1 Tax=Diplodia intermedia TaxID=856260 RepID=A0ABR3TJC3_9PEZI